MQLNVRELSVVGASHQTSPANHAAVLDLSARASLTDCFVWSARTPGTETVWALLDHPETERVTVRPLAFGFTRMRSLPFAVVASM